MSLFRRETASRIFNSKLTDFEIETEHPEAREREEGEIFMRCFSFSKRSWYGKIGAAAVPITDLCRFFCILDRMDQTYLNECMHNSTGQLAQLFCYAILRCFQRSLIFFVQRYLQRLCIFVRKTIGIMNM